MTYQLNDSGIRQEFETGARRDTDVGKGRPDLLSPYAMMRLAIVAERGARKYGDRNWERGMPLSRFISSAERHIQQLKMGSTDEDHAAHAMWNLMAFIHTQVMLNTGVYPATLGDMPNYEYEIGLHQADLYREIERRINEGRQKDATSVG